jgi:hypothetical protein
MTTYADDILDKYRYINVGHDWWDFVEEQLRKDMRELGFSVEHMHFSGFSWQGDGAQFTGYMSSWKTFVEKVPTFAEVFPNTAIVILDGADADYVITSAGQYCHERGTGHNFTLNPHYCGDPLSSEGMMRQCLVGKAEDEECDVEEWLRVFFRDRMRKLYRDLEQEYDYLTSDEIVSESIKADNLHEEN